MQCFIKEKGKLNDLIRVYTEEGDYLIEKLFKITYIDRRFSKKIFYEAQSLDELIDLKFLEDYEFELVK